MNHRKYCNFSLPPPVMPAQLGTFSMPNVLDIIDMQQGRLAVTWTDRDVENI